MILCVIFAGRLKRQKILQEKDARAIFMQILSGLRYLNRPFAYASSSSSLANASDGDDMGMPAQPASVGKRISIIHYDLKPANILFDEMGDVKITGNLGCLTFLNTRNRYLIELLLMCETHRFRALQGDRRE